MLKIRQEPASLETPVGEEEDTLLGDLIEDEGAALPAEVVGETMQQEELTKVLARSRTASARSSRCASVCTARIRAPSRRWAASLV